MLLHLWRSRWSMAMVFGAVLAASILAALLFPTSYTATSRVLVRPGSEHGLDPAAGDAPRIAYPQALELLAAEAELARSSVIAERVIRRVSLQRLYPALASRLAAAGAVKSEVIELKALEAFERHLIAEPASGSAVLRFAFSAGEPRLAADTLNILVEEYIAYRREVLGGRGAGALSTQRAAVEERLRAAEASLQMFLAENRMSDFESELDSVTRLLGALTDERSRAEAARREAAGRAAGLDRRLRSLPREIDLFTESSAAQPASGLRRIGPNPTHQNLEAGVVEAGADADALASRSQEIARQRAALERRRIELAAIEPEFQRLARERDALKASARAFAEREQAERVRLELGAASADNITVYEPARMPIRGESLRPLAVALGALLGAALALAWGLLRAWSMRTLATPRSVERASGLPVLAAVMDR